MRRNQMLSMVKYFISVLLVILLYSKVHIIRNAIGQLLEILIVFLLSQLINSKTIRSIVCGMLMFLISIQILLFYYGNTYLSLLMVTNIVSIQGLKGNAAIYLVGAILTIIIALLPSEQFRILQIKKKELRVILLVLIIIELSIFKTFGEITPLTSLSRLSVQAYDQYQQYLELKNHTNDAKERFYKSEIENYIELPKNLKNKPNIILIFTEVKCTLCQGQL